MPDNKPKSQTSATVPPKNLPENYAKLDDDFGEPWVPDTIGEQIRGIFLGIDYVPSDRGRPFITHRIKTDDGIRSVASAVLERRMARIPEDTPVILVYQGKLKAKKGDTRSYDVYYPANVQLKAPKPPDLDDEYRRA